MHFDELQRMVPAMIPKEKIYSKVAQVVLWQFYNNLKVLSALAKKGKRIGRLRFKPKTRFNSINYNQSGFRLLDHNTLKLSKIGKIKINLHRPIQGKIKEIHVKRELGGDWYTCIITESEFKNSCSLIRKKIVGLDVGINNFVYDSDGHVIEHPQILRKSEKKLKRSQRKLSRKVKRPQDSSLDVSKANSILNEKPQEIHQSLDHFIKEISNK